jgi:serine phosphatase RsbU (regulator of sigma subunit)
MIYSLETASPEKLLKTAVRGDEFGKISRYLMEFFSQKSMLLNKLTELNHIKDDLNNLNDELQSQKEELLTSSEKLLKANEEITESIKYASIIQYAVLNVPANFCSAFSKHFILYKPKSIVSGDFYWIQEKNGLFYIACADCTGHSLAGALLSMLGISFLKDIFHQQNDLKASEILNYLREFMVETLNQTGEFGEAHGGMDIVFCIMDPTASKLHYAGAFNSFYIVADNKETSEKQLTEYKGDAMPVGIYIKNDAFTNHTIELNHGDMLFFFSDGFVDQFGGPNNKKFRSNKFKELLLSISEMPCDAQKKIIEDTFEKWKGNNDQTDDVMIMGIRYEMSIFG